ncbi:MAG: peptidoglycan-binding protein [Calothrix sp. C42_A2020_038]|nr:peptidoglycan-binding protein [Calothrix sp. C42_A2020_038]
MPVLSTPIQNLINNARFTAAELVELEKRIKAGQAKRQEAEAIATRYADTLEAGVGSWLNKLLKSLGSNVTVMQPIANLANDTDLLNGIITLPDNGRNHPSVGNIQRALIALASRTGMLSYMLPEFGADGDYGNETIKAVRAFQQNNGLVVDGKVGSKTAKAIDAAIRKTNVPGITGATPKDLVDAAIELSTGEVAKNYGVPQPWVNIDPRHNVPANKPFEPLKGRWKCNLFGGNVLRKGGYEPPYYRDNTNDGKGEYPHANQWFRWTDKYASANNNPVRFQLIDEIKPTSLTQAQLRTRLQQLFAKVQPGDFLMVDHLGGDIQDGGHTRVATKNNFQNSGTIFFAQASYEHSLIREESIDALMSEEAIWLMRPNTKM